ncbi:MAG TPA: sensor histidine kinase KdpD [Miltoncostaeaceae bacterium]|nr:sensor histidine kinase KdpD [Miltoncostaeaceae bacterium]
MAETVRRGRLKVYVGMAAGVGKTYTMLEEGQDRRRDGEDVVIGWLETHGRAETAAMAEGLEVVPPLGVEHRGVPLRDMDVDAVIARAPEIALVDELAHTNAPGMARAKRYEDVQVLQLAAIDVISTVNVQHLESLNDRILELTGVRVRETIPDQLLLDADEVVLVDLTPEALQARLRAGKVYPQDRVEAALLNFFTTANLGTLREVALREVADSVDERVKRDTPGPGVVLQGAPAPLVERVMVIVRPELGAQRLTRAAWRAARRLGAELDVVMPEGRLDDDAARQRDLVRSLAVTLGAHFLPVAEEDLTDAVVSMAEQRGVTRLAMATPPRRGLPGRLRGDLLSTLLDRLEGIDILLLADRRAARPREER